MPYRLPKDLDTPTNNDWMEVCVFSVLDRGKNVDEGQAISICKSQLISKKGNQTRANVGVLNKVLELNSENRRNK
jgi:hypothetical protein